jgi:hypothetical protein
MTVSFGHCNDKSKRGNVTSGHTHSLVSPVTPGRKPHKTPQNTTKKRKGRALMGEHTWLAEQFEAERPHLRAVAYRMLGSLAEATPALYEQGAISCGCELAIPGARVNFSRN